MARAPHWDDNFIAPIKKQSNVEMALDQAMAHYEEEGRKAREEAKEMETTFLGNPLGVGPGPLARAVLFLVVEAVEANKEAVLAAVQQGAEANEAKMAVETLIQAGTLAQDVTQKFVATRCFRVKAGAKEKQNGFEDDLGEGAEARLKEALKTLRRNGTLAAAGIAIKFDSATRSTAAKEVENLAVRGKGGGAKTKQAKKKKKS